MAHRLMLERRVSQSCMCEELGLVGEFVMLQRRLRSEIASSKFSVKPKSRASLVKRGEKGAIRLICLPRPGPGYENSVAKSKSMQQHNNTFLKGKHFHRHLLPNHSLGRSSTQRVYLVLRILTLCEVFYPRHDIKMETSETI
jgi:hypothetical protein